MNPIRLALCAPVFFVFSALLALTAQAQASTAAATAPAVSAAGGAGLPLVASPLNQEFVKIFPELAQGYIDFNGNGKPDQTSDLNEYIPATRVKDGQLRSQDVLDFIVANWRFIPLAKLKAVQQAVNNTPGAINELIAIDFSSALDDAISQRQAMGDLLYLTPSAYKAAMMQIGGIITTMATAYKKEGAKAESDFVTARDSLFGMIEKGYPLPDDIPAEERATLSTAMVSTILKARTTDPTRTKSAIRTLGKLKAAEAASYLLDLAAGSDYQLEATKALGDIGYKPAVPVLVKELKTSQDGEIRKAALLALGAIGSTDSLDAILELLKPANRAGLPKDLVQAEAQALAGIAVKGNADNRIQGSLKDLSADADPAVRRAAAAGLGAFANQQATDALIALLGSDKDPQVRTQAVASLNKLKGDTIVPAFLKVLKEKDLDPALEITTLKALGDNPGGSQAVGPIVDDLADKNPDVRAAAAAALRKLYPANQQLVTGSITRSLLASQDASLLADGTALLAALADQSTLPSLLTLLQSPYPEVKRNVTWAMYRIRSAATPRVLDELQKLITNENEAIPVRVNAVRAVGAIGVDNAQLNLWQTLVTTTQMRGEKYASLRLFAVRSLGQLGAGKPQVVAALARIAQRETDLDLRREAVTALRNLAVYDAGAEDALSASFAQTDDPELKVLILEALADMGSARPAALAGDFLAGNATVNQKRRAITALSESASEESANVVLDAARDARVADFAEAVLEGYPASLMTSLVERRLRTETDKNVISVLNTLSSRFSE